MAKPWDDTMKRLIRENPLHFVNFFLKRALFKDFLSVELKNRTLEADTVLKVILEDGKEMLLHIEFQSTDDAKMEQRMLEYNVLATREHKKHVYSCVIYLREENDIAESPLVWAAPDGYEILRFYFVVVKLWELLSEDIIEMGLVGLLPLIPLTKDGKQHEVTERMIDKIVAEQPGLLQWAKIFAGLVFKDEIDREWLERKFAVHDSIINESWVIQEAIQKGKIEGQREGLSSAILKVIEVRFPEIVDLTKKPIKAIADMESLENLLLTVSGAKTGQEILHALINLDPNKKKS